MNCIKIELKTETKVKIEIKSEIELEIEKEEVTDQAFLPNVIIRYMPIAMRISEKTLISSTNH